MKKTKKICVITCYKYPDYVRGEVIRNALKLQDDLEVISIVNKQKNFLRYPEVIAKLIFARLSKQPDIYMLTFRGYEILPFVRIITLGKKLVFDEFINLIEWVVFEHKKLSEDSLLARILKSYYRFLLKSSNLILTDTDIHAEYSSKLMNIPIKKYKTIPVGADEKIFEPATHSEKANKDKFEIFYYGNMLPLHGIEYVCKAALKLKAKKKIHFTIIGGKSHAEEEIKQYIKLGANITYIKRVPLKKIFEHINSSDLCLGGPFGGTVQSEMVITGKTYQFIACGKPALIGKINDPFGFKDKKNCLIVPQADSDKLSEAILWARDNRQSLKKIADGGRKLFEKNYTTRSIGEVLKKALDTI